MPYGVVRSWQRAGCRVDPSSCPVPKFHRTCTLTAAVLPVLPPAPCQSVANALGRLITVLSLMKTPAKRWSRGATSGVPRVMTRSAKRWSRAYRKCAAWGVNRCSIACGVRVVPAHVAACLQSVSVGQGLLTAPKTIIWAKALPVSLRWTKPVSRARVSASCSRICWSAFSICVARWVMRFIAR